MGKITIVTGPPCGGKSTYVSAIKKDGDIAVDFDAIATSMGATAKHGSTGDFAAVVMAAREKAIEKILEGVTPDAWIIHTSMSDQKVSDYQAAGADFVLCDPGIDECLLRCAADGRPDGTDQIIRDWYQNSQKGTTIMLRKKTATVEFKTGTESGLNEREFLVYPSTFIRKADSYGDVVAPGAFAETINKWVTSGNVLPGLFGHKMDDPDYYVASAIDMGEDEHGWWVKGIFDTSPKADRVYQLVKDRRITQLSFAFDVLEEGAVELDDGTKANELRKLEVYEFSFVPIGANQDTSVEAVKSPSMRTTHIDVLPRLKAGRVLSAKNEKTLSTALTSISDAVSSIKSVLSQIGGDDQEDEKSEAPTGGKASILELLEQEIGLVESEKGIS